MAANVRTSQEAEAHLREQAVSCADCRARTPNWVALGCVGGAFVCDLCAEAHKTLRDGRVKVIDQVRLDELSQIHGNEECNTIFEHSLPPWYSRPTTDSPSCVREAFVKDKYERKLFVKEKTVNDTETSMNTLGHKEGPLMKKMKEGDAFKERYFVSSNNHLQYFVSKTDYQKNKPRETVPLSELNAFFLKKEEDGKPFPKQKDVLIFCFSDDSFDNHLYRFIYVAGIGSCDLGEWYQFIRRQRYNHLQLAFPMMESNEIAKSLTRDVHFEDWIFKRGPNPTDRWLKRYVMLMGKELIYMESRKDAHPKGEICITTGCSVQESAIGDIPAGAFPFTLCTTDRNYAFYVVDEGKRKLWHIQLSAMCAAPVRESDTMWGRKSKRLRNAESTLQQ